MNTIKIDNFYKDWLKILPQLNEGYLYDNNKNIRPSRYIFSYFKNIINNFLNNKLSEFEKIILLPGIRGVGKTTLLMQILKIEKFLNNNNNEDIEIIKNLNKLDYRFYFDVSKLHFEQITLNEFFKFFERTNNFNFIGLEKKVLLLLDEIHFDAQWELFLKILFDSIKGHNNLLVIVTGSSAINIKMSADLMRRATIKDIFPINFKEYLNLKYNIETTKNILENLQDDIFNSREAKEVFHKLKKRELETDRFFMHLPVACEDDFLKNGGFPFTIGMHNQVEITERVRAVINGIIIKDVITLKRFKTETIGKIDDLLYLLANSDLISYEKIQKSLHIENIRTLSALLEVLVMSGVLVKIKSYGQTYGATRKTPKYFFITPSLRNTILNNNIPSGIEGKKLEDYFSLIFEKDLKKNYAYDLRYDFAEGGADFILTLKDKSNIVIELGFHKEETKQVEKTMKKVKSKYGLIFGSNELELINNSLVKIPLKFLLLL